MTGLYQPQMLATLQANLTQLLPQWGLSCATTLTLLCISENATYRADDPESPEPIVLRVHRPGYHTRDEIASELQWLTSLRDENVVRTARPIPSQSGEFILEFNHESSTRCVVAFEFLPGSEPSESDDLCEGFEQLGAITARLHQHVRRWALPKTFTRKRWDYSTMLGIRGYWGDWRDALGIDLAGRAVLAKCADTLEKRLAQWGTEPDRFGLIHADLRLANLLVDNNNLAVIDFDDCGFGWFLYDFAAAISFIETSPQIPDAQAAWIEGYRSIKALSKKDVAAIPMFVMLRRQLLTAWIASHSETPTAQELGTAYTEGTVEMAERWLSTNRSL